MLTIQKPQKTRKGYHRVQRRSQFYVPHEPVHGVLVLHGVVFRPEYLGAGSAPVGEPAPVLGHHFLNSQEGGVELNSCSRGITISRLGHHILNSWINWYKDVILLLGG